MSNQFKFAFLTLSARRKRIKYNAIMRILIDLNILRDGHLAAIKDQGQLSGPHHSDFLGLSIAESVGWQNPRLVVQTLTGDKL